MTAVDIQGEQFNDRGDAVLAEARSPGIADGAGPGLGHRLAFGHKAVVEGQLTGGQVAADQQAVPLLP